MKAECLQKSINEGELKKIMKFYPTLEETASWFNCSPDTIERRIKEFTNLTFKEFRHLHAGKTRLLLKRKAIELALEGDQKVLLHCLKSMTDIREVTQDSPERNSVIRLNYALPKL